MIYTTILTSKGTTTIPKEIRDQLGIKPGMLISFSKDPRTNEYILRRSQTITEVRDQNRRALEVAGTKGKHYTSGAGYTLHVSDEARNQ